MPEIWKYTGRRSNHLYSNEQNPEGWENLTCEDCGKPSEAGDVTDYIVEAARGNEIKHLCWDCLNNNILQNPNNWDY